MQLREYIDDTKDYINIQVIIISLKTQNYIWTVEPCTMIFFYYFFFFRLSGLYASILKLDNYRNQLIQVCYSSFYYFERLKKNLYAAFFLLLFDNVTIVSDPQILFYLVFAVGALFMFRKCLFIHLFSGDCIIWD